MSEEKLNRDAPRSDRMGFAIITAHRQPLHRLHQGRSPHRLGMRNAPTPDRTNDIAHAHGHLFGLPALATKNKICSAGIAV